MNDEITIADIELGLIQGEFKPWFQPIVVLRSQKLIGYESLVRWHHPTKGLIFPDEFIPLIESDASLAHRFSRYIIRESCSVMLHNGNSFVSINVDAPTFALYSFAEFLETAIEESGLNPERVCIEITERLASIDKTGFRRNLESLHKHLIYVCLDDFGTGHNSLLLLSQSDLASKLKIDKEFIWAMEHTKVNLEIVRMLIILAHRLDMHVIAEGIETREQADLLWELGCDYGQGYYFAKPSFVLCSG